MLVSVWGIIMIFALVILIMPRRLTFKENIIIFPIVGYFAWISHIIVGVMLDFLDFGPTKKVEFTDWALVSLLPSILAILFLNFKVDNKYLLYVFIWTILSFLIELALSLIGYMKHSGWSIWYSIPVYFLAYVMLHLFFNKVVQRPNR